MMTALNLIGLGSIARDEGDYKTARVRMEEALQVLEAAGKKGWTAVALINLGDLARLEGNYDQAARYYEESRDLAAATGVAMGRPPILHNLAYIAHYRGDDAEARKLFEESLSLFSEMGDRRGMAECVAGLACLMAETKPAETARLFGAATAAMRALGTRLSPSNEADYDQALEAVHARLDYAAFQAAWTEGEGMTLKAAAAQALQNAP